MKSVLLYEKQLTPKLLLDTFKDFITAAEPVADCDLLIRWGNVNGNDSHARTVLNRRIPLKNCLDKANLFETLRLNRIRRPRMVIPRPDSTYPLIGKLFDATKASGKEILVTDFSGVNDSGADFFVEYLNVVKKFNVYLFDCNVFLITKKVPVKTNTKGGTPAPSWEYEAIPGDLDQDTLKISLLAIRALHVLGLDFGMVHAGIDTLGRPVILDVTPVPSMNTKTMTLFYEQVRGFTDRLNGQRHEPTLGSGEPGLHSGRNPKTAVLLGADPEFMLRDTKTGEIVYPSDYVTKEGSLGYDERSENREGRLFPLAEVRPEPTYCPIELTERIRDIFVKAMSIIPPHVEWLAGSVHFNRYQIGGHIHFSNIQLTSRLLRALDNYVGIPTMLIEDPVSAARRRKQYGWLGSIRCKPHGGFEYRTPASWLVTPELTTACLCLGKIVATEYLVLTRDYFTSIELQKAFYQGKKHLFYDIFNDLWSDVTRTSLYGTYLEYLLPLTELIQNRSYWNEDVDLRKTWRLNERLNP